MVSICPPQKRQRQVTVIIFDCDGVLFESVSAKTDAFRELFSGYPECLDEIVTFHLDNGGMSRFEKFRHIYSNILKVPLSENRFNELSREFELIVYKKVIGSPFVEGVCEFLKKYEKMVSFYVVSATPETELKQFLKERGISHFFTSIYGSPTRKEVHLKEIIKHYPLCYNSIIFIGDAKNDYDAARIAGLRFIARIKPEDPDRFAGLPDIECRINNIRELDEYFCDCI